MGLSSLAPFHQSRPPEVDAEDMSAWPPPPAPDAAVVGRDLVEEEGGATMAEECCRKPPTPPPPPPAWRESVLCFLPDPLPTVAKSWEWHSGSMSGGTKYLSYFEALCHTLAKCVKTIGFNYF